MKLIGGEHLIKARIAKMLGISSNYLEVHITEDPASTRIRVTLSLIGSERYHVRSSISKLDPLTDYSEYVVINDLVRKFGDFIHKTKCGFKIGDLVKVTANLNMLKPNSFGIIKDFYDDICMPYAEILFLNDAGFEEDPKWNNRHALRNGVMILDIRKVEEK